MHWIDRCMDSSHSVVHRMCRGMEGRWAPRPRSIDGGVPPAARSAARAHARKGDPRLPRELEGQPENRQGVYSRLADARRRATPGRSSLMRDRERDGFVTKRVDHTERMSNLLGRRARGLSTHVVAGVSVGDRVRDAVGVHAEAWALVCHVHIVQGCERREELW